jgi:ABC-type transporter Mla MlaB component
MHPAHQADRCPHRRPFQPDFAGCPTFQAVGFIAADSQHRSLGEKVTCGHLTAGSHTQSTGRYYARCGLGSAADRARWLALVSPTRIEKLRALQDEFDKFTRPQRELLLEIKAAVLRAPVQRGPRARLEHQVTDFLDRVAAFLADRDQRFQEVGLPRAQLQPLIDDWCWAWANSRELGDPQSFLGAQAVPGWHDARHSAIPGGLPTVPVFEDGMLRISRTVDPPRLAFNGDIDASNLDAVADALAVAVVGARDLEVDLSGVMFCDLGGLRALVHTASRLQPPHRLLLIGTPHHVRRVLDLVGWAALPNLVLAREAA